MGERKTASTWPPLQVALRSETDVFTLLPATSMLETPKVTKRQRQQTKEEEEYKCGHGIVYEAQSINVDMVLSMRIRV